MTLLIEAGAPRARTHEKEERRVTKPGSTSRVAHVGLLYRVLDQGLQRRKGRGLLQERVLRGWGASVVRFSTGYSTNIPEEADFN